jgi:hypothetical protein
MSDLFEAELQKQIKEVIDASLPQTFLKFSQSLQKSQQDLAMEDVDDEPVYDEHAELRRREEEARQLLLSRPVNIPRRERQS